MLGLETQITRTMANARFASAAHDSDRFVHTAGRYNRCCLLFLLTLIQRSQADAYLDLVRSDF